MDSASASLEARPGNCYFYTRSLNDRCILTFENQHSLTDFYCHLHIKLKLNLSSTEKLHEWLFSQRVPILGSRSRFIEPEAQTWWLSLVSLIWSRPSLASFYLTSFSFSMRVIHKNNENAFCSFIQWPGPIFVTHVLMPLVRSWSKIHRLLIFHSLQL